MLKLTKIVEISVNTASSSLADWYKDRALYLSEDDTKVFAIERTLSYNTMGSDWPEFSEEISAYEDDTKVFDTLFEALSWFYKSEAAAKMYLHFGKHIPCYSSSRFKRFKDIHPEIAECYDRKEVCKKLEL